MSDRWHGDRRPPRSRTLLCALLASLAVATGCSRHQGSPAPPGETLLRGGGAEPDSLDPQKARSVESQGILRDLCEGLTTLAKDASVAPGVASDWEISADGTTYTFHLRPQARWSNGDRVVAADFVTALRRLVDPATASAYAQVIDVIANAAEIATGSKPIEQLGVTGPDEHTVVITLRSPAAYLPSLLSHTSTCPIHRPTLATHPTQVARPGVMVSNGAFMLQAVGAGLAHSAAAQSALLERPQRLTSTAVKYLLIPDENAELTRYRAGELQISYVVPRGQFDWIRANLGNELHISPQLNTYYYGFNLRRAPFKDQPGLRAALSMVIDREKLVQRVLRVGELPAYGWVPAGVQDYTSQSFDYRKTAAAGTACAKRNGCMRRRVIQPANPLRFELRYNAGEVHSKVAVAVASMWKEALGAEVRLTAVEFKSLLQDIDRGDVEMFRSSWLGDYNDAYTFLQYLKSGFGINLPHYQQSRIRHAAGACRRRN